MNQTVVFLALKGASGVFEAVLLGEAWRRRKSSTRTIQLCLVALLCSHFLGDITNLVTGQYAFPKNVEGPAALGAKFVLRFIHVAFAVLILKQLGGSQRRAIASPQMALGIAIIAPFMARFASSIFDSAACLSTAVMVNELFLFAVLSLSFPLAVLVLSSSARIEWCCLAGGILVAILGAVGKRYESWAGIEMESYYYEIFWTLGLLLQGGGAVKLLRHDRPLGAMVESSNLKTSKTALLAGTNLTILAIMSVQSPGARSIENAIFVGAFGVALALILTVLHNRAQSGVVKALQKLLAAPAERLSPQHYSSELPIEYHEAFTMLLAERDEFTRWKGEEEHRATLEREILKAKEQVYDRIMHDIRSPLAALSVATDDLSALPEERRLLIQAATRRIRGMADDLLAKGHNSSGHQSGAAGQTASENIGRHLEAAVSEKRFEFSGHEKLELKLDIDRGTRLLFASINQTQFRAVISNLINNAAEAMGHCGQVRVSLDQVILAGGPAGRVVVADNGPGIPPELCSRLGTERTTSGKTGGHGIGLFTAQSAIASWGGNFEIASTLQKGTEVHISLPVALPPSWLATQLVIEPNSFIVVVDDDDSIHRIWELLLKASKAKEHGVEIIHCYTRQDFETRLSDVRSSQHPALYLIDYEIARDNGLTLIARNGIAAQSVLVTSHDENQVVRKQCEKMGTMLLPKMLAQYVEIQIATEAGLRTNAGLSPFTEATA